MRIALCFLTWIHLRVPKALVARPGWTAESHGPEPHGRGPRGVQKQTRENRARVGQGRQCWTSVRPATLQRGMASWMATDFGAYGAGGGMLRRFNLTDYPPPPQHPPPATHDDLPASPEPAQGRWDSMSAAVSSYRPHMPEYDAITWLGIGLAIFANMLIAVSNLHTPSCISHS